MNIEHISIDDEKYTKYKKVYEYAINMIEKEVHQAVEGMYHNLNTLQSRSGNQLPFTSINYGTCTLPEGRMITKALLEVSKEGLGKYGKTSIFPCGIFQCQKDVNRKQGDPNYDLFRLALSSSAQRIYPNYVNVDWSTNLNGNKFDRDQKTIALSELSTTEYNKLYKWLKNNKEEASYLSLKPVNDKIIVEDYTKQNVYEITSTMGKCTATAHLKSFEPRSWVCAA